MHGSNGEKLPYPIAFLRPMSNCELMVAGSAQREMQTEYKFILVGSGLQDFAIRDSKGTMAVARSAVQGA